MEKNLRELSREGKMKELSRYYASELSEDAQDGTKFDLAVFEALEEIEDAFSEGADPIQVPQLTPFMLDNVNIGDLILFFNYDSDYHWGLFDGIVYNDEKPVMVLSGLSDNDFPIYSNGELSERVPIRRMLFPISGSNYWFVFGEEAKELLIRLRNEGKEVSPAKPSPTEYT